MLARVYLSGVVLSFSYPNIRGIGQDITYPYLVSISDIRDSSSSESGNAQIILSLQSLEILGFPLGTICEIVKDSVILFSGILNDITIDTDVTLQLEA